MPLREADRRDADYGGERCAVCGRWWEEHRPADEARHRGLELAYEHASILDVVRR